MVTGTHMCATHCPGPKWNCACGKLRPSTAYHVALLSVMIFFTFIALCVNELAQDTREDVFDRNKDYKLKWQWNKFCLISPHDVNSWECADFHDDDKNFTYGKIYLAMTLLSFFWEFYMIWHVISMDVKWVGFKTQAPKRASRNFLLAVLNFILVTISWLAYVIMAPAVQKDEEWAHRGASINLMITVWVACSAYLCTSFWTTHVKLWGFEEEVPEEELEVKVDNNKEFLPPFSNTVSVPHAMNNNKYAPAPDTSYNPNPPSYNAPPSYNDAPPSYNDAPPSYDPNDNGGSEIYVPSSAPTAPSGGNNLGAQIRDLKDLHSQGILDDEEFALAKAKLLN